MFSVQWNNLTAYAMSYNSQAELQAVFKTDLSKSYAVFKIGLYELDAIIKIKN